MLDMKWVRMHNALRVTQNNPLKETAQLYNIRKTEAHLLTGALKRAPEKKGRSSYQRISRKNKRKLNAQKLHQIYIELLDDCLEELNTEGQNIDSWVNNLEDLLNEVDLEQNF